MMWPNHAQQRIRPFAFRLQSWSLAGRVAESLGAR